jgi:mono/diheme cytochrome c family protein
LKAGSAIVAGVLTATLALTGLRTVGAAVVRRPDAVAQAAQRRSVWEGVFTEPQAARGAEAYQYSCATCHASDLEGDAGRDVPALYGEAFVDEWGRHTLKDLFDLIRKAMPKDSPGSLKAETYADIVAFLLQANQFPPGSEELPVDPAALERIGIDKVPPVR